MSRLLIRVVVVVGGLVTLGIQVLVPRLLHPLFGSGVEVAAAVVGASLAGLAVGYRLGGRPTDRPTRAMATAATAAAAVLVVEGILLRLGIARAAVPPLAVLVPLAAVLVGVPSLALGMLSPLAIQGLGDGRGADGAGPTTIAVSASVFALGTSANVVGGLVAGFYLVPFVGISVSLIGFGLLLGVAGATLWPAGGGRGGQTRTGGGRVPARLEAVGPGPSDGLEVNGYKALAMYSGIASVALEVNASRMLASYFGPTTGLWAAILTVALGGLAVGYGLGGRVPVRHLGTALPLTVAANGAWLVIAAWFVSNFEPTSGITFVELVVVALVAFGPPFVLFGVETQLLVGAVWVARGRRSMASAASTVFSASSIGGIAGALLGLAYLIPALGVSGLVRLFVVGYLVAVSLTWSTWRAGIGAAALAALLVPLPDWRWEGVGGRLVAQEEGRYQTIRVYTDDRSYLRFHLGPTYESEVNLSNGEPRFGYSQAVLGSVGDVAGSRVLIVGGAGHALGHAFENRGATVTEVEIDPAVRSVSDEFFGPLQQPTVVEDGRRFITQSADRSFDIVVIDAFAGPRYVPPHLTTREFFEQVQRVLAEDGTMYMNIISATAGSASGPFEVISSTVASSFPRSGFNVSQGNVILIGSNGALPAETLTIESARRPNTDDLNPVDILLEMAR